MSGIHSEMKAVLNRFNARKNVIMSDMGEAVVGHTRKAFEAEGYAKSAYVRWTKKKRYDGFAILHNTNDLSRSTHVIIKTWPTLLVRNDTPYADFHNEGDGVPIRHFLDDGPGKSPALDRRLDQIMDRHIHYVLHG